MCSDATSALGHPKYPFHRRLRRPALAATEPSLGRVNWLREKLRSHPARGILVLVASAFVTAYVALAVTDLAPRPWKLGDDPIDVRAETDPRAYLSDLPFRWERFDYVIRRPVRELGRPPNLCHRRQAWGETTRRRGREQDDHPSVDRESGRAAHRGAR